MGPARDRETVLAGLSDVLAGSPDELTVRSGVLRGPDGGPALFLSPAWSGRDAAEGDEALARLDALGTPIVSQVGPTTTSAMLSGIDALFPFGQHAVIRFRSVPSLTPAVRDVLGLAGDTLTPFHSAVSVHSLHGAATRVPVARTAFGNRDPHLMIEGAQDGDRLRVPCVSRRPDRASCPPPGDVLPVVAFEPLRPVAVVGPAS